MYCQSILPPSPGDNKGDVNYDPNNPDANPNQKQFKDPVTGEDLNSECFPVKYYDPMGQEISPYQIKVRNVVFEILQHSC